MVELISKTEDFIRVIATGARVCYSGLPLKELLSRYTEEDDKKLIRKVVKMGHLSVVEHGVFTFKVSKELKEELFKILMDKPYLKISERENSFIVSLNLRTVIELAEEKPDFKLVKEIRKFIPDFLKR